MSRTLINLSEESKPASLTRGLLNTSTPGSAVVAKIVAGFGITIASTGIDAGTGDVNISTTDANNYITSATGLNTSVPLISLTPNTTTGSADIAIMPKGFGAFLASNGGNKRGTNAVDLQTNRTADIQIASGAQSVVIGGASNTASGLGATSIGGMSNTADGAYGLASGHGAVNRGTSGVHAHANGSFVSPGDAQLRRLLLRGDTGSSASTILTSDATAAGTANQLCIPTGCAIRFRGDIVAHNTTTGDAATWSVLGCAKNVAGVVSIVGTATATQDSADAATAPWVVLVQADTVNLGVKFTVTGVALQNIRWLASITTIELI